MKKVKKGNIVKEVEDYVVGDYVAAGWEVVEDKKTVSIKLGDK